MQLRRGKGAAALAFAVVASALGTAPAVAAPPAPTASADDRESAESGIPPVWPRPQSLRAGGTSVAVPDGVVLVTGSPSGGTADPYALDALRTLLRQAGARKITTAHEADALPARALVVYAGQEAAQPGRQGARSANSQQPPQSPYSPQSSRPSQPPYPFGGHAGSAAADGAHALGARAATSPVERALTALGAAPRADLPTGGYRLAVGRTDGRDTVALAGVGEDGLFHAVQTLRQLIGADGRIAGVVVRDWPGTAVRGTTEGFYGTPWSREQRLAQADFMGRTKQNRYVYAPGDDLYRQARWREPYPAEQRAEFRELAERARGNHVTLAWAVAPGQAMCFASDADVKALTRKLDAMWALGFRVFQLQFQDVSYSEWHCGADADMFGSGPEAAAKAQARVANAVARHLAERHPDAAALSLMPTEYYEDGSTTYRRKLSSALDEGVEVAWTGVGVVPRTITGRELARTREAFGGHPLVTMDNYPVNDYAQDRVFLGPYQGREPAVATGSAALLANAMPQAEASRIPLFTAADYAWNPRDYRPQESWKAAIDDLADGDARRGDALRALAGNDASSVLGGDESAYLRPLMEAFWQARTSTDRAANETATRRLRAAFTVMRETPQRLADGPLAAEVAPWTAQLARYGEAGETAVAMLRAQADGDATAAWTAYRALDRLRGELAASQVTVGKGVLDTFLTKARKAYETWAGLDHEPAADRGATADGRTVRFPHTRALTAVSVLTEPGTTGSVEAHLPGEGWRRLGSLSAGGATELTATDLHVDALRVTGPAPSRVRHLVPWFADSPATSLKLARSTTDVEIGGTERVTARLTSLRPADVNGELTTRAPQPITVRVPETSTLPRGTTVDLPIEVTVPPGTPSGTYAVPVTFGAETRTLTVRAFPRTTGPDLARSGVASSSGDETADFPASAANDGDPETRWSSPIENGAWWQVRLAEPARLGRLVLHWQDAYPSSYRIQVSADGRTWRTATTVDDGHGGRESLRFDERDVRYVRVQGVKRATQYGYSLWTVEAYAVAD
ncbi:MULTISPECIES: beta-N-acetylglucosaminidase domain-containing protein [Streptomyces]|uniref:Hyaluronidase n=1 Tax=Streptomyces dengpaensis TaxID=2049881 RepID=A0ABM6SVK7_9ACTN|nr:MULTISPECIES: beta-N-acetylglucosaminidase domain-containing protein [Streptomyces]AVH58717.1 hyaluronidase [Streptomyces dengpaensis]PIB11219.1 hyaluronidase [Streptomyces sp. HG99]